MQEAKKAFLILSLPNLSEHQTGAHSFVQSSGPFCSKSFVAVLSLWMFFLKYLRS